MRCISPFIWRLYKLIRAAKWNAWFLLRPCVQADEIPSSCCSAREWQRDGLADDRDGMNWSKKRSEWHIRVWTCLYWSSLIRHQSGLLRAESDEPLYSSFTVDCTGGCRWSSTWHPHQWKTENSSHHNQLVTTKEFCVPLLCSIFARIIIISSSRLRPSLFSSTLTERHRIVESLSASMNEKRTRMTLSRANTSPRSLMSHCSTQAG